MKLTKTILSLAIMFHLTFSATAKATTLTSEKFQIINQAMYQASISKESYTDTLGPLAVSLYDNNIHWKEIVEYEKMNLESTEEVMWFEEKVQIIEQELDGKQDNELLARVLSDSLRDVNQGSNFLGNFQPYQLRNMSFVIGLISLALNTQNFDKRMRMKKELKELKKEALLAGLRDIIVDPSELDETLLGYYNEIKHKKGLIRDAEARGSFYSMVTGLSAMGFILIPNGYNY